MTRENRTGRWLALMLAMAVGAPMPTGRAWAADVRPTVAVAAFDYRDTSGETRDQGAQHAARLLALSDGLRADLQASGRYDAVVLSCGEAACAAGSTDAETFLASARDSGATVVVFGGVHKVSTLVQFAQVEAVDVRSGAVVYQKLYTFRGDTDEAWQRAEEFIAADMARALAH